FSSHSSRVDSQDDRLAASLADVGGRRFVRRQVDVMPAHFFEAFGQNRRDGGRMCAVKQNRWWSGGLVAQFHSQRVALIGANAVSVNCESLLRTVGSDLPQFLPREIGPGNEVVDIRPAGL